MHKIDRQPQIQWSIALQLGLFGHLATVLTQCTLQLSLSRTVSQWSVSIGWNCIITPSLQGLAGFNHSVAILVLCHCADVCCSRLIGCVMFTIPFYNTTRACEAYLWGVHGNFAKQYTVSAMFWLLREVIHGNALLFIEIMDKAFLMPGQTHVSL